MNLVCMIEQMWNGFLDFYYCIVSISIKTIQDNIRLYKPFKLYSAIFQ